ncbi:MAG: response regulator [bacterium]|nr:response regulator [bacterium]
MNENGKTILIVDDNEVNLELIVEQFKSEGFYSLLTAGNGSRAIELALEKKPDMILMDIQMPGMDGNEAIRQLRQRGYRRPIIAISAYAMKEETQLTLELGADDYITKPIDFDTFFNRVGKFLTGDGNRIKATVFDRIRGVFLKDARKKLDRLQEILAGGDITSAKDEVEVIAHTYKGNASYMGLKGLEAIAKEIDRAIKKGEPDERLSTLTLRMADVLRNIITPRRGDSSKKKKKC